MTIFWQVLTWVADAETAVFGRRPASWTPGWAGGNLLFFLDFFFFPFEGRAKRRHRAVARVLLRPCDRVFVLRRAISQGVRQKPCATHMLRLDNVGEAYGESAWLTVVDALQCTRSLTLYQI